MSSIENFTQYAKHLSQFFLQEIDEAIAQARTRGYSTIMTLGHKGLTYATNVVVKTAIKVVNTGKIPILG